MKKNIFDKFQDWIASKIEQFDKREDKDVLKKISFWMLFFFPYAFYLLIFKSKINKIWKAIFIALFGLLIIIGLDTALYPNRVYNSAAAKSYNEFISDNEELKLEEVVYISKNSHFKINNQMYFMFDVYDRLNMYKAIFKVNDYSKNYKLISLYDIDYNFENIYAEGEFKKVKDVHPNILSYLFATFEDLTLNEISKVSDVKEDDIFDNIIYQEVKVKDSIYNFKFNDFTVFKVYNSTKKENLLDVENSKSFTVFLPKTVITLLTKNFDSTYKIIGYNYFNSKHFFNIEVGDKFYIVEYLPGSKADLFAVDDLDEFKSHFKTLIYK